MDASALLSASLSPVASERDHATSQLAHYQTNDTAQYLLSLSRALQDPSTPSHIRNAAGLAIKNALFARESLRQDEYAARWKAIDSLTREKVKNDALHTLAAVDKGARNVAGQVVAAVAAIELPAGLWNGLIAQLLQLVGQADNSGLRQATLQAIGYICESIVRLRPFAGRTDLAETGIARGAIERDPDCRGPGRTQGGGEVGTPWRGARLLISV